MRGVVRAGPMGRLLVLLAWALLGAGCSDYQVKRIEDPLLYDEEEPSGAPLVGSGAAMTPAPACLDEDALPDLVGFDEACASEAETASIEAVVEWERDAFIEFWEYDQILMAPVVGQLTDDDGDGDIDLDDIPDIVVMTDDGGREGSTHGILRRMSGDGSGDVLSRQRSLYGDGVQIHPYRYSNAALGDLNGDGVAEVVVMSSVIAGALGDPSDPIEDPDDPVWPEPPTHSSGSRQAVSGGDICVLTAYTADLELLWVASDVQVDCGGHAPALVDLEGDGSVEALVGPYIVRGTDGALLARNDDAEGRFFAYEEIGMHVTAADLDMDGVSEVILGHTLVDPQGNTICQASGLEDGYTAPADVNADGFGEVVVVGNGVVGVYDHDCRVLSSWTLVGGGTGGPPTISDFDIDGEVEIGVAEAETYTVYERDGTVLWSHPVSDDSSYATGSVVFDFEADGRPEVVYADETRLWILAGEDGAVRLEDDRHASRTLHEYPTIADLDGDGASEIIVPNGGGHQGENRVGLYVLGAAEGGWLMSRPVWNQHAYSIVNVGDDLSIPAPAVSNWPTHNNFRSGDPQPLASWQVADPVPVAELCLSECEEGRISVLVRAGNSGSVDFDAGVPVSLYTQPSDPVHLGTEWTTQSVAPGAASAVLRFELAPSDVLEEALWLVVDDDNGAEIVLEECLEDNNELWFEAVQCP
ncbi:MAG: hypothetical protein CL927_02805 [Deltaproteobacteria bacterium]|nr:hypothetical protein [Deltaproteobacteria bacterium]